MKNISVLLFLFLCCSCEKVKEDKLTNTKWVARDSIKTVARSFPLVLSFDGKRAILESPGLTSVFELASILHTHGTGIAGREPRFEMEYKLEGDILMLTPGFLSPDIELKVRTNKLIWPLWRTNDSIEFVMIP